MKGRSSHIAALEVALDELIGKYGVASVREACAARVRRPRGAPSKKDWSLMHPELQADARKLLRGETWGGDSAELARRLAEEHPQTNTEKASTRRRFRRKLTSSKRVLYVLYNAFLISMDESAYSLHLAITKKLESIDEELGSVWARYVANAQLVLSAYTDRFGEPSKTITFEQIRESLKPEPLGIAPRPVAASIPEK